LLLLTFLFSNCATTQVNPFEKFFNGTELSAEIQEIKTLREKLAYRKQDSTFSKTPKLYVGNIATAIQDCETMKRENYVFLGFSMFNGGKVAPEKAVAFGEKLWADYVLLYSSYTNTISGTLPITSPSTKTETTRKTGNVTEYGNIYGIDESASFSGNTYYSATSTKSTQENNTTYFPYRIDRYDYTAIYFLKNPMPIILGIRFQDLPLEVRKK